MHSMLSAAASTVGSCLHLPQLANQVACSFHTDKRICKPLLHMQVLHTLPSCQWVALHTFILGKAGTCGATS